MIAALVLAAGGSSRLGRPKQLEPWGPDETLLDAVMRDVRRFPVDEIWVVLGAHVDEVLAVVDLAECGIIENQEWSEGLASSLRAGLDALNRQSRADAALVVMGDQPGIDPAVVHDLLETRRTSKARAVIPKYRYIRGNPVLLDRSLWPRIMSLSGDEGARQLLQAHPEWVEEVWVESLPPRDVDTETDVQEMRPRR